MYRNLNTTYIETYSNLRLRTFAGHVDAILQGAPAGDVGGAWVACDDRADL